MKKKNIKSQKSVSEPKVWIFLVTTFLALIPEAFIKSSYKIYMYLAGKFGTYPGDIWYCWEYYMRRGATHPAEYPSGFQILFRIIHQYKPLYEKYETYFIVMFLLLAIFAIFITFVLFQIVKNTHKDYKKLWLFWILAPSFLVYGLINLDFIPLLTIVVAYYLFISEDYDLSAALLALGTAVKVFPVFLAPLFLFQAPKKVRLRSVIIFVATWLAFNLPFMLTDWNSWAFPYKWQITNNIVRDPSGGGYWWVVYQQLVKYFGPKGGEWVGKISLILYGSLYAYFLKKRWHLPLARKCAGIMILFLLTDRVYSPQYNLYLLPFLVLVDYKVDLKYFYAAEILNITKILFLYKLRTMPMWMDKIHIMPVIDIFKFYFLVLLFLQICYEPIVTDTDEEFRKNLPRLKGEKPPSAAGLINFAR